MLWHYPVEARALMLLLALDENIGILQVNVRIKALYEKNQSPVGLSEDAAKGDTSFSKRCNNSADCLSRVWCIDDTFSFCYKQNRDSGSGKTTLLRLWVRTFFTIT